MAAGSHRDVPLRFLRFQEEGLDKVPKMRERRHQAAAFLRFMGGE